MHLPYSRANAISDPFGEFTVALKLIIPYAHIVFPARSTAASLLQFLFLLQLVKSRVFHSPRINFNYKTNFEALVECFCFNRYLFVTFWINFFLNLKSNHDGSMFFKLSK